MKRAEEKEGGTDTELRKGIRRHVELIQVFQKAGSRDLVW